MIETQKTNRLSLEVLQDAVKSAAAFRLRVKLSGIGGESDKVFPPTYAGGVYSVEDRRIDGRVVRCALLDSVQSQANRMAESLLNAFLPSWRELDPKSDDVAKTVSSELPLLAVRIENHSRVTSLTDPHRFHDASIRDCEIEETDQARSRRVRFGDSTVAGEIDSARTHKATAIYKHCPTALIFGTWDSTAGEGLDSTRFLGAVVSEIIGVDITPSGCTWLRIDPLGIRANSATVDRLKSAKDDRIVDVDEDKNDKKKAQRFGEGKPADINHGNVVPNRPRFDRKEIKKQGLDRIPDILETTPWELRYDVASGDGGFWNRTQFSRGQVQIKPSAVEPGGVTMAYALHTWTLSLTQLRHLQFPIEIQLKEGGGGNGTSNDQESNCADERNEAARTVLAALALYALVLLQEEGYWLRSRCELVPEGSLTLEQVGGKGGSFSLGNSGEMRKILDQAISRASNKGLEWSRNLSIVKPRPLGLFERLRRWLYARAL